MALLEIAAKNLEAMRDANPQTQGGSQPNSVPATWSDRFSGASDECAGK